jgi:hypothetical protein
MVQRTMFVEYEIGDILYMKTDPDQLPHIVTAYYVDEAIVM